MGPGPTRCWPTVSRVWRPCCATTALISVTRAVALLCTPGHDFVVALLASWWAGGVAVPLHPSHPDRELAYYLADSDTAVIVYSPAHKDLALRLAGPVGAAVVAVEADASSSPPAPWAIADRTRRAMMLYTSGTAGRPKGVVHTHGGLQAQVESLVDAWDWSRE